MRAWYRTDADDALPEYKGVFSEPIPTPDTGVNRGWQIVAVDWSERGIVEITWLVPS